MGPSLIVKQRSKPVSFFDYRPLAPQFFPLCSHPHFLGPKASACLCFFLSLIFHTNYEVKKTHTAFSVGNRPLVANTFFSTYVTALILVRLGRSTRSIIIFVVCLFLRFCNFLTEVEREHLFLNAQKIKYRQKSTFYFKNRVNITPDFISVRAITAVSSLNNYFQIIHSKKEQMSEFSTFKGF